MELHFFQTFLSVARCGSFAAAARENGVDPSSISRQIASLEQELGYRLFDRTTRRLALTEAGKITFDRIQNPLEEISQIQDAARDVVGTPSGVLRVSTSVAFGERWLVPRLAKFKTTYPEININLLLSDARVDLVADNIDVAIRLGDKIEGPYITSRLLSTRYRVVASPKYLSQSEACDEPGDISTHDCIAFPYSGYRSCWRFKSEGHIQEVEISNATIISNALAIRRAALEGMGLALLSDWTVRDDIDHDRLVDVLPNHEVSATEFDTAAWVLYPSREYVPTKTRVIIDYLRSNK